MSDWTAICAPATALTIGDIRASDYCDPTPLRIGSPIDEYYEFVERLVLLGTPSDLAQHDLLGRLLILGLVSGVESYLRSIMSRVLRVCPLCRAHAAEEVLPLGALDYYSAEEVELGILDRGSLASEREIRRWTKKLLFFDIPRVSAASGPLHDFDLLCNLRHAAVHAEGRLGTRNATTIGLSADAGQHSVRISYSGLQQAGAICHAFVRGYNSWLWEELVTRWNGEGVLTGLWRDDRSRFGELFRLFRSERDRVAPAEAKDAYRLLPFGVRMRAS